MVNTGFSQLSEIGKVAHSPTPSMLILGVLLYLVGFVVTL